MKKLILLIFIVNSYLQAQSYVLNINLKNGSTSSIPIDNITEIFFDNIDTEVLNDPDKLFLINSLILFQNYPNPFNPSTAIKYSLQKSGNVLINIYNINGKIVKSFIYNNQKPGEYTFDWDGKDLTGCNLSSGIYLYKIQVDNKIISRRMTLIR